MPFLGKFFPGDFLASAVRPRYLGISRQRKNEASSPFSHESSGSLSGHVVQEAPVDPTISLRRNNYTDASAALPPLSIENRLVLFSHPQNQPPAQQTTSPFTAIARGIYHLVRPRLPAFATNTIQTVFPTTRNSQALEQVPPPPPAVQDAVIAQYGYSLHSNAYRNIAGQFNRSYQELMRQFGPIVGQLAFHAAFETPNNQVKLQNEATRRALTVPAILHQRAMKIGDDFLFLNHLFQLKPTERKNLLKKDFESKQRSLEECTAMNNSCLKFDRTVIRYRELCNQIVKHQTTINRQEKECVRLSELLVEELKKNLANTTDSQSQSLDLTASAHDAGWNLVSDTSFVQLVEKIDSTNKEIGITGERLAATKESIENLLKTLPPEISLSQVERAAYYQMVQSGELYPSPQWSRTHLEELYRDALATELRTDNQGTTSREARTVARATGDILNSSRSPAQAEVLTALDSLRSQDKSAEEIVKTTFQQNPLRKQAVGFLQQRQEEAASGEVETSFFDEASSDLLFQLRALEIKPKELALKYLFDFKGGQDDTQAAEQQLQETEAIIKELEEAIHSYRNTLATINRSLQKRESQAALEAFETSQHDIKQSILRCKKTLENAKLTKLSWEGIIDHFKTNAASIQTMRTYRDQMYRRDKTKRLGF